MTDESQRSGEQGVDEGDDSQQDVADAFIERLEQRFGERWGGAWLQWEPTPSLYIALVEPAAEEADLIARAAADVGWIGGTVAVRYSASQLERFHGQLAEAAVPGDPIVMHGVSHEHNKVLVVLNQFSAETIERVYAAVPHDAVVIRVEPGAQFRPLSSDSPPQSD